jgi:hypothetical protein
LLSIVKDIGTGQVLEDAPELHKYFSNDSNQQRSYKKRELKIEDIE